MNENIKKVGRLKRIAEWLKKEIVLSIAVVLAIVSSFYKMPKLSYINFKVLILLFNLMVIIAAFKHYNVLDYSATYLIGRSKSLRQAGYYIVGLTFVAAMFMTNDVALITFVPLTLIIGQKLGENVMKWVVFQTLAANLGSSLTPMGNPQNLFIYTYYDVSLLNFMQVVLGMVILAVIFMAFLIQREKNKPIGIEMEIINVKEPKKTLGYMILFIVVLASVIEVVDYRIALVLVILYTCLAERRLFAKIDYTLLLTFIGFFIFVGNLAAIPAVKALFEGMLKHRGATYLSGVLLSQVISNVPATMLLAPFTENWKELVLGVDVGGMGTLIASMASIISYKLYIESYPEEQGAYFRCFTKYNVYGLLLFIPIIGAFCFWLG